MYNLTDHTGDELATLAMGLTELIKDKQQDIESLLRWDDSELRNMHLTKSRKILAIYEEHKVHLMTSLAIVAEKEKVLSN